MASFDDDGRVPPPGEPVTQEWFCAGLDRRYLKLLAQYILAKSSPGTFFIREKKDHPGSFALSAKESSSSMLTFMVSKSNNPNMHWTKRSQTGWTIRGSKEVFDSISDMVEYFCEDCRPELGIQLVLSRIPSVKRLMKANLRHQKRMSSQSVAAATTEVDSSDGVTSPFIKFAAPARNVTRAQHVRLNYAAGTSVVDDSDLDDISRELAASGPVPTSTGEKAQMRPHEDMFSSGRSFSGSSISSSFSLTGRRSLSIDSEAECDTGSHGNKKPDQLVTSASTGTAGFSLDDLDGFDLSDDEFSDADDGEVETSGTLSKQGEPSEFQYSESDSDSDLEC